MDYDYIDKLLKDKGMSRRQLAIKAGISINNMSGWFTRKTIKVPDKYILAIANVLNVDPWYIKYTPEEKSDLHRLEQEYEQSRDPVWEKISGELEKQYATYTDEQLLRDFHRLPSFFQRAVIYHIHELLYETSKLDLED